MSDTKLPDWDFSPELTFSEPHSEELEEYRTTYLEAVGFHLAAHKGFQFIEHFLRLEKTAFPDLRKEGNVLAFMNSPNIAKSFSGEKIKLYKTQVLSEVYILRCVAAFEVYLSSLLRRVFSERPDLLRSSQATITYEQALDFDNRQQFIEWATNKKGEQLSYEGLPKIVDYLAKMGCSKIDKKDRYFKAASEYLEVRNIISHNAGKVSSVFLKRTGLTRLKGGDRFPIDYEFASRGGHRLIQFAGKLDAAVVEYFGIKCPRR